MATRTDVLPAAVSPLVAADLAGPVRPARVLAVFPTCVYVGLADHHRVLAVSTLDALELPIRVRLALGAHEVTWGVGAGDAVDVGGGRVVLGRRVVVATRTLRATCVTAVAHRRGGAAGLGPAGVLGELVREVVATVLEGRDASVGVRGLVGAGAGLTPSGDDALCGALLVLASVGGVGGDAGGGGRDASAPAGRTRLVAEVRAHLHRTTSISAALLDAACRGHALPGVARLVRLVAAPDPSSSRWRAQVGATLAGVLAVGHSSGHDLVAGVVGALEALDDRRAAAPFPDPEGLRRA